jgi:hypothetical protein
LLLFAAFSVLLLMNSCAPSKCVLCEAERNNVYQIELNENAPSKDGKHELKTFFSPVVVEKSKKGAELHMVDCDNSEPYLLNENELEPFIRKNLFVIDTTWVKRIVSTSDADVPPIAVSYMSLVGHKLCNRYRNPFKIEIRGMVGLRNLDKEGLYVPVYNGGTLYTKEFVGFGLGGTNMTLGAEVALLPRISKIGKRSALHIGLLTGYWPVDGGSFIPLSIHPRFTLNDQSSPLFNSCNAWYLFGDLGTAIDAGGRVPLFANNKFTSTFWGGGIGFDKWLTKRSDVSVDLGYRLTNMALPINDALKQCLIDAGLSSDISYPYRSAGQVFLRLGFTF